MTTINRDSTIENSSQEPGSQRARRTDNRLLILSMILITILLSSFFFKPVIKLDYLRFIDLRSHFFYLVPALLIGCFLSYCVIAKVAIKFNLIDLLLVLYGLFLCVNYAIRGFNYNENLVNFTLTIFAVVLLKQFFELPLFGLYLRYSCFFLIAFFGLYEVLNGELQLLGLRASHHRLFNLTGTFHNPGPYAIFLSPVFIFSLAVVVFPPTHPVLSRILVGLCWLSLIGIGVMLPATGSRSAWLGTLAGSALIVYAKHRTSINNLYFKAGTAYRLAAFLTVFVGVLAGAYWLYQYKPESADGRALIWRISSGLFRNNVLFGAGFEQFRATFGNLQSAFMEKHIGDSALVERADYVPYAMNDFLQILLENGVIGLAVFAGMLFLVFRVGWQQLPRKSPFLIGSTGALVSLTIAGFFSYPFEIQSIWLLFLFYVGIVSGFSNKHLVTVSGRNIFLTITAIFGIACMVFILKRQIHLIKMRADWKQARNLLSQQSFQKAATAYRAAFLESPERTEVLSGYGKALYMAGEFAQSAAVLEKAATRLSDPVLYMNLGNAYLKLNKLAEAEKVYKKAIAIIPNRLYPRYLLAKFYQETGDLIKARRTAHDLVTMPVPVDSPASRQIRDEMQKLLDIH